MAGPALCWSTIRLGPDRLAATTAMTRSETGVPSGRQMLMVSPTCSFHDESTAIVWSSRPVSEPAMTLRFSAADGRSMPIAGKGSGIGG